MPDAGIFLDYPDVTGRRRSRESFTSGVAAWFDSPAAATGSDEACLQHYANETWRCWFGQYVMPFSKVSEGVWGDGGMWERLCLVAPRS